VLGQGISVLAHRLDAESQRAMEDRATFGTLITQLADVFDRVLARLEVLTPTTAQAEGERDAVSTPVPIAPAHVRAALSDATELWSASTAPPTERTRVGAPATASRGASGSSRRLHL
jgi:hypothetical protein